MARIRNGTKRLPILAAIYIAILLIALCRMASAYPLGDANRNGEIDGHDLSLIASWMGRTDKPQADINGNGIIDFKDFAIAAKILAEKSNTPGAIYTDPRPGYSIVNWIIANTMGDEKIRFSPPQAGGTTTPEVRLVMVNGDLITPLPAGARMIGPVIMVNSQRLPEPASGRKKNFDLTGPERRLGGWWISFVSLTSQVEQASTEYFLEYQDAAGNLQRSLAVSNTTTVNPPRPDIGVASIALNPPNAQLVGDPVTVTATVVSTASTNITSALFRCFVQGPNVTLTQVGTDVRLNLAAGTDTKTVSFGTFNLVAGANNFSVVADPLNAIAETNENNNSKNASRTTTAPNLFVQSLSVTPATTIEGRTQTVRLTVGGTFLSPGTGVDVKVVVNNQAPLTATALIGTPLTFATTAMADSYTVTATVDPLNKISESSESDNTRTTAVANLIPDFGLSAAVANPTSTTAGSMVSIALTGFSTKTATVHTFPVQIRTQAATVVASGTMTFSPTTPSPLLALSFVAAMNTSYTATVFSGDANPNNNSRGIVLKVTAPPGPPAPGKITVTPGNGQLVLSWSPVSGATSYEVGTGSLPGQTSTTQSVTTTGWVILGLTTDVAVYGAVRSVGAGGKSTWSNFGAAAGINPQMTVGYNGNHLIKPGFTDPRPVLNWTPANSWQLVREADGIFRFHGTARRQAFTGFAIEQEANLVEMDSSGSSNPWAAFLLDSETNLFFVGADGALATSKRRMNTPPPGATHFVGQNDKGHFSQLQSKAKADPETE